VPVITTVEKTILVVAGYQQVAVGTIQVPTVTWVTTTTLEVVDLKKVDVGDRYYTMTTTLEMIGYYNPNADEGKKQKRILY
jgi:hypothetical protein